MNLMLEPQAVEWVHAVGWTLLHFLWQGALVAAAYGVARMALAHARPQARYALGLGALALLAALPVATLAHLAPVVTGALDSGAAAVAIAPVGATLQGFEVEPWLPVLVGVWLVGVAACALRALLQYLRIRRLCRLGAEPLPEWDARLRALCRRFGVSRPIRLVRSALVQTPSLFGWIAPVIVLPASVFVGLTPQQIELVIAHELGHVRRWDYAVNLAQVVVETVLFYHPAVHWISRDIRNEREACCDDLVLRLGADPVDYAQTLTNLEELRGVTHAPALAASGGHLLGRIRRIVGVEPRFGAPAFGAQAVLVAALAFAAVMSVKPVARDVLNLAVEPIAAPATATGLATRVAGAALERTFSAPVPAVPASAAPSVADVAVEPVRVTEPVAAPTIDLPVSWPAIERPRAPGAAGVSDLAFRDASIATPVRPRVAAPPPAASRLEAIAIETLAPEYPRRAALAGVEGEVLLSFRIDASGRARDIRIASASGDAAFSQAATSALRRWRFSTDAITPGQRFAQAFEFALGGGGQDGCKYSVGSRICRRLDGDAAAE